jgi:hypothetical protein
VTIGDPSPLPAGLDCTVTGDVFALPPEAVPQTGISSQSEISALAITDGFGAGEQASRVLRCGDQGRVEPPTFRFSGLRITVQDWPVYVDV